MVERSLCLFLVVLLVGCTSETPEPDVESTQLEESSSVTVEDESPTTESVTSQDAATTGDAASEVAPLRPDDEAPPSTTGEARTSAYISRVNMSATSIELTWSTSYDADEYHLHRLEMTSDDKPDVGVMTADNTIHVASEANRFVDDGVEAGARYWYGIRALSNNGDLIVHGWHRADAVTDTEPPALVRALEATFDDGEVLLTWSAPDENYELHGYRVFRGVDGEAPESLATTWRLDQTSFVDDEPPTSGQVTYAVVAFDFHWNDSAPAEVQVDLSG